MLDSVFTSQKLFLMFCTFVYPFTLDMYPSFSSIILDRTSPRSTTRTVYRLYVENIYMSFSDFLLYIIINIIIYLISFRMFLLRSLSLMVISLYLIKCLTLQTLSFNFIYSTFEVISSSCRLNCTVFSLRCLNFYLDILNRCDLFSFFFLLLFLVVSGFSVIVHIVLYELPRGSFSSLSSPVFSKVSLLRGYVIRSVGSSS